MVDQTTQLDRLRYRLALVGLSPILLLFTLWSAARRGGGLRYIRQRLGFWERAAAYRVWLHAASVGEVNAAAPLLERLLARDPQCRILVTTNTPSGAATAHRHFAGRVVHGYLPIDWPGAVQRFVNRIRPDCALIMETELWPHLYRACAEKGVPLVLVNARLSPRTLETTPWLRRLYGEALATAAAVLARDDRDRDRFLSLGADPARCRTIGNIKFAALAAQSVAPIQLMRPYVVAASTREEEERLLLESWRSAETGERLLVIVPRHPQRSATILAELTGAAASVAVRSRGDAITQQTDIYLADTFGELTGFLAGAELVVMGGSLVAKGGQNLLEPAALGRPVVVGPHMDNFRSETDLLLAEGAVVQVGSAAELSTALTALLAEPTRRELLASRARAVVEARRDMAERYLTAIDEICPLAAAGRGRDAVITRSGKA